MELEWFGETIDLPISELVIHDPDFSRGTNGEGDVLYGTCGYRVLLEDLYHWYGRTDLINCGICIAKMPEVPDRLTYEQELILRGQAQLIAWLKDNASIF